MNKIFSSELMHTATFLKCLRRFSAWWVVLVLLMWLGASPAAADEPPAPPLKDAVMLLDANSANNALSMDLKPGTHDIDLYLQVIKALKQPQQGKLIATTFRAQASPGDVVAPTMRIDGRSGKTGDNVLLDVSLAPSDVHHVTLTGGVFRPGATYKGSLFLTAGDQTHRWDIILKTPGRSIIAVGPLGTLKFSRFRFWFLGSDTGSFPFTLYDKSDGGPYHHVRVRFEPGGNPPTKAITSNFNLDSFSFKETKNGKPHVIDLEQRENNLSGINLDYHRQRTFNALIKPLSPGEYTGALRFVADESSDDAAEAKLPVTIQVRDYWALPVLVIFIGSLMGWYGSKYIISVRRGRELARQVKTLRARVDNLARPDPPQEGWEFAGEATSYGLALVRVQLSQLDRLTCGLAYLFREEEIQQQRREAELRVSGLELLHSTRLQVQKVAFNRPTAQWALDRLLSKANDLFDGPTFDQTQMTALTDLLNSAKAWIDDKTFEANYRQALATRLTSQEIPSLSTVQALPKDEVQQQLEVLLSHYWPTKDKINNPSTNLTDLQDCDQTIAKVALLWREKDYEWATDLARACERNEPINDLFQIVDSKVWEKLKQASEEEHRLIIEPDSPDQGPLQTYDLVVVRLRSHAEGLGDWRVLRHPLRVRWSIDPPDHQVRFTTNHDLTMVQYFPDAGQATIAAFLQWQGDEIPVKEALPLNIVPNPELGQRPLLSGGIPELVVIAIAFVFAVATAMATQYDSTFGSPSQYLALLLWSAGVGTGGNIFKQLGTTSTPGGQADVQLPTGGAAAGAAANR